MLKGYLPQRAMRTGPSIWVELAKRVKAPAGRVSS